MNVIDLNKPLIAVGGGSRKLVELFSNAGQGFFIRNPNGKSYWLCNLDGTVAEHENWRIENAAQPVTYTATVVWYERSNGEVGCLSFTNPDTAYIFQTDCRYRRFVSKQVVSITV